ncbi:MAG: protein kinase [candidate division Zixibacteria bacterium]
MSTDDAHNDRDRPISLSAGTEVSHYRIVEKIGEGGMGEVYLAEDSKLNRRVALKFLPAHYASDDDFKRRFTREAEATARLNHPNIVTIYEVGEHEKLPYFAMELVEGQSLKQFVSDRDLSLDRVLDLGIQICDGLAAAHAKQVSHRDIKPANILIDSYGRPKILDFGLATIEGTEHLTRTGSTLGTVQYMSPEQTLGKGVDYRTDLFSFGVMLYELITSHTPFARENAIATGQAIMNHTPDPLARYRASLPEMLQIVVAKLLEKDPTLRYQSALDVVADLKRMVRDVDSGVSGRSIASLSSPSFIGQKKSRAGFTIGAVVVTILIIAGAYFLFPAVGNQSDEITTESAQSDWKNSIAVLPFRDFSANQDQEFFCDGMTDAIIGKLSGLSGLKVISMTSVMRYKTPDRDLRKIGEQLKVAAILEGSVQRENDRVRIRAQLIKVSDDAHLWSDTYDRDLESIFSVQDEISRSIVDVMKIKLLGTDELALERRGTESLDAYSAYSQGRFLWRKRTEQHIRNSIEVFTAATELDSNYAEAWSGLADAWSVLPGYSQTPREDVSPKAWEAAERALKLNSELCEAHASMGLILWFDKEHEEAEKEFLRAIELNSGYVWAHTWFSSLLVDMGRTDESTAQLEISLQLDPLNNVSLSKLAQRKANDQPEEAEKLYQRLIEITPNALYYRNYAQFCNNRGRTDDAFKYYRLAIDEAPTDFDAYRSMANLHSARGHFDQALLVADEFVKKTGDSLRRDFQRGDICYNANKFDMAVEYLREAVRLEPDYAPAWYTLSQSLSQIGMIDEAIISASKHIGLSEDESFTYLSRGRIYLANGHFKHARADFEKALRIDPENDDAPKLTAIAYIYEENLSDAHDLIDELSSSSDLDGIYDAVHLRAAIATRKGKLKEAISLLDAKRENDTIPAYILRYRLLQKVFIYEELGQFDLAMQDLQSYVKSSRESNTGDMLAWRDYIPQLLSGQGNLKVAIDSAESLKNDVEASGRPNTMLGYWLARGSAELVSESGDKDLALRLLKMSADDTPRRYSRNYFQAHFMYARACLAAGDYLCAIGKFEELLKNFCEYRVDFALWMGKARYYIAIAYEESANDSKAIEHYEAFLDQWKDADAGLAVVTDAQTRLNRLKPNP